ncbi:MTAP family purine nucleoside phosphorylase [Desulfotomaculum copahuensis]|uniref:Phosphorylase n=1 Tax=Desulfotomaculum copahuensis TaxID=1838280 RepID=A0A1B7LFV1_9FIRM|nr:MTAP family purine nucleoside phosphorylase [Desulfotomaculum copahuensis]OAT83503.1 phosphorylase [Desulfotomaculum copahuensis]
MTAEIPRADFAIIGGSSTFSLNFPEDLHAPDISMIKSGLVFDTPYGESPPMKFFTLGTKTVLNLKMHGWRPGVSRADASRQVFWVFRAAGVKKILSEGGVGAINHLLRPRDILVPSDYIDFSMRKDVELDGGYLLTMRRPVCADLSRCLTAAAEEETDAGRVFDRGIYAVTDGRHFESVAEVDMLKRLGADVVGQSMCPEVYLARETGACYARLDVVTNYAEGIVTSWGHDELENIFYAQAALLGGILLSALRRATVGQKCGCPQLRHPTLLKTP